MSKELKKEANEILNNGKSGLSNWPYDHVYYLIDKATLAERERIKKLITKEIALAHIEGAVTSRLTSLVNILNQQDDE